MNVDVDLISCQFQNEYEINFEIFKNGEDVFTLIFEIPNTGDFFVKIDQELVDKMTKAFGVVSKVGSRSISYGSIVKL